MAKKKCSNCLSFIDVSKNYPQYCPSCNIEFWDKPRLESDLFFLQKEFIEKGRDRDVLEKMYPILFKYGRMLLLKKIKNKIVFTPEVISEHSHYIAERIIRYFLKSNSWKVDRSFAGAIGNAILETLYGDKENDQILSLNFKPQKAENNREELGELKNSIGVITYHERKIESDISVKDILTEIKDIIQETKFKKGEKYAFYTLLGVLYLFENKEIHSLYMFFDSISPQIKIDCENIFHYFYSKAKLENVDLCNYKYLIIDHKNKIFCIASHDYGLKTSKQVEICLIFFQNIKYNDKINDLLNKGYERVKSARKKKDK